MTVTSMLIAAAAIYLSIPGSIPVTILAAKYARYRLGW